MFQEIVDVLWNKPIGSGYFRIGLQGRHDYRTARPGQFVMLQLGARGPHLLRRPFSIHRLTGADRAPRGIELLYKVVGPCTRRMSRLREGDGVDLLGPLGKGFRLVPHARRIILAAGGIGVAPLFFWAQELIAGRIDPAGLQVFLGGRSRGDILCRDAFVELGLTVRMTTDDGSAGDHCLVTRPLETILARGAADVIYACGPMEMLKCVAGLAARNGIACQLSIETMMACGLGACLGCAVKRRDRADAYWHACVDGPVIDAHLLDLDP